MVRLGLLCDRRGSLDERLDHSLWLPLCPVESISILSFSPGYSGGERVELKRKKL